MGKLMCQKLSSRGGVRLVAARSEVDGLAKSESLCSDRRRSIGGEGVGMDTHRTEIGAVSFLHFIANRGCQHLATAVGEGTANQAFRSGDLVLRRVWLGNGQRQIGGGGLPTDLDLFIL